MRVSFSDVFDTNPNGSVTPKAPVKINGMTMGPGVVFTSGVSFGGVDLTALADKDLEVEQKDGVIHINGHYP